MKACRMHVLHSSSPLGLRFDFSFFSLPAPRPRLTSAGLRTPGVGTLSQVAMGGGSRLRWAL